MKPLLAACRVIDVVNARLAVVADWLILLACLVSAGNASIRYLFGQSSNAWLEIQWYMFAALVMLGAPYTLQVNEHVRVDVLYGTLSGRAQVWIDILGGILFLIPMAVLIGWFSWPIFANSFELGEESMNAGGLLRWPVKILLPIGFALLALQGLAEIIKRIAVLRGQHRLSHKYHKPLQ